MRDAVIVSTARTAIGRAYRGALNNIKSPSLAAHAISNAVARAGLRLWTRTGAWARETRGSRA